ncbi:MAG: type II toxin-antitoxin system ParD family antitoxin [Sphingomonas fennica]
MADVTIALTDPMHDHVQRQIAAGRYVDPSDYVRDLIRRDQAAIADEAGWLRALDASVSDSVSEMRAGGGVDLETAYRAVVDGIRPR